MMHAPMLPCAEYSMELVARRSAAKTPSNFEPGHCRAIGSSASRRPCNETTRTDRRLQPLRVQLLRYGANVARGRKHLSPAERSSGLGDKLDLRRLAAVTNLRPSAAAELPWTARVPITSASRQKKLTTVELMATHRRRSHEAINGCRRRVFAQPRPGADLPHTHIRIGHPRIARPTASMARF